MNKKQKAQKKARAKHHQTKFGHTSIKSPSRRKQPKRKES